MLETFELNTFNYRLFLLLAVIIMKVIITAFVKHEPLQLFQVYCQLLSNKVCRNNATNKQQVISGIIAVVITLTPILLIFWLFSAFIEVQFLWHGFMLYLSLGAFGLTKLSKNIAQQLTLNQTYLAKQQLSPFLLRETSTLSNLGLAKACIEMLLLKTLQQAYVTSFLFIIFGPLTAFAFRLLLEMHYAWNIKLSQFLYFGRFSAFIIQLIQWLPVRLFSLLLLFMCIGNNFILFWRLSKENLFKLNNDMPLQLLAYIIEARLGGVAMYESNIASMSGSLNKTNKLRKKSFNDLAKQPQPKSVILANHKITTINAVTLILLVVIGMLSI